MSEATYSTSQRAAPTGYQLLIIVLMIFMAALDGFDAFSSAFVAPAVAKEWGLGSAALGILLSSGFVGMALGSMGYPLSPTCMDVDPSFSAA